MDHEEWRALSEQMAAQYIASELTNINVPFAEGLARAEKYKLTRTQEWLRAVRDMGAALIALESLGYDVTKKEIRAPDWTGISPKERLEATYELLKEFRQQKS